MKDEVKVSYNWWEDEEWVTELNRRADSYLSGTSKVYTVEESIAHARQSLQNKKSPIPKHRTSL